MRSFLWMFLALGLPTTASGEPGDGFDVEHYRVDLSVDYGRRSIEGRSQIDFRVTSPRLLRVDFSPNALKIRSAAINGRQVRVERQKDVLAFIPARPLRPNSRARLEIDYSGSDVQGLTFGATSVHSSWFACSWMVCLLDKPGDKATVELSLTVPEGQTTLGPGTLVARAARPDGLETHRWRSQRAYSSYLFSFAAGRFVEWRTRENGVDLRVLSESARPEELQRLFAPTGRMLSFFERRAGVAFPWASYSQLHLPGSAAQETLSYSLVGDQTISPILGKPDEDWVIAHELAHQWWGNLVTCVDWTHFWLNEGIVTFMTAAWKEERWGRPAYEREMELARRRVQSAKAAGVDVPLTFAGPYPSLRLSRAITYSKGALFLDTLRTEIGEKAFWDALRRFTVRHAGGVVTSRDFQRAAEEASGRDLSPLFDQWVYLPI